MTDLLNGKIDILDFEINPETTLEEFENAIGNHFKKDVEEDIICFYLNNDIGVLNFNQDEFSVVYSLNNMDFINVVILFVENKIWQIKLITDMVSFDFDELGKKIWSDAKRKTRFNVLNEWSKRTFGEPNYSSANTIAYEQSWGRLKPSSIMDSGNSTLHMNYNK